MYADYYSVWSEDSDDSPHSKYSYLDGIGVQLPLNAFMKELYGDSITLHSPCMPYKENSGTYDQLMVSSVNAGHCTRILVADNENTVAVVTKCSMRSISGGIVLERALGILTRSLRKGVERGLGPRYDGGS